MINLPSHLWFMGNINFKGPGNTYSGSLGCDPALGNIDGNSFRYLVKIVNQDDTLKLRALYYIGEYAVEATDESLITERFFESSSEGIEEAQDWLNSAAEDFLKKKDKEKNND